MKAFHKAGSIIPFFFPVPPAGKGWKYYPRLLHSLPEELETLLCLGTCPKPWSTHLTKQSGLERLWNVPQLPVPVRFLTHSSQEETGTGVNQEVSPCSSCLACAGPELGMLWRTLVPWSWLCRLKRGTEAVTVLLCGHITGSEGVSCMLLLMQEKAVSE